MRVERINSSDFIIKHKVDFLLAVTDMIKRSKSGADIQEVLIKIGQATINPNVCLFVVFDEKNIFSGFCLLSLYEIKPGVNECMVDYVYVNPGKPKDVWNTGNSYMMEFAKQNNCIYFRCESNRNPEAFKKKLGKDWIESGRIYRKEIK